MDSMFVLAVLVAVVAVFVIAFIRYPSSTEQETSKKKDKPSRPKKEANSEGNDSGAPSKAEISALGKNIPKALQQLKTQYPPDSKLITGLRSIVFSGDIDKLFSIAKGYIPTATKLTRQMLDDSNSNSNDFMNIMATLSAICTTSKVEYKEQAGNPDLIKTLSDACEKYSNDTYFDKKDREKFVATITMLLAGITGSEETVKPIITSPRLFDLAAQAIHNPNACLSAVQFYHNISFCDPGRALLRTRTQDFYEALVQFLTALPMSLPDAYGHIYLTLSNLYLHSPHQYKVDLTKILVDSGFMKALGRDIRRLQLDAVGLLANIFQDYYLYDGVLSFDLVAALADATGNRQCGRPITSIIAEILYSMIVTKNVAQVLLDSSTQEPLGRLAECQDKKVAEYAEVLLAKIGSLAGEIDSTERKCSRAECTVENDKLKKCSQCSSAWYCSKECQVNDWTQHKALCVQLKERDGNIAPKKTDQQADKNVSMKFLHEHVGDFDMQARKQGLTLDQCAIVVDFTQPARNKIVVFAIPQFFSERIKKVPFTLGGNDRELLKLKQSHANLGQPAFIGIVILPGSVSAFVVPLILQTVQNPPNTEESS